jgi:hypothetical protein
MRSEAAGAVALPYFGGNFSEVDNANGVRTSEKTLVRVDLYITANIGRYVVSILHDRPLCSFDITWPKDRDYGSNVQLFLVGAAVFQDTPHHVSKM